MEVATSTALNLDTSTSEVTNLQQQVTTTTTTAASDDNDDSNHDDWISPRVATIEDDEEQEDGREDKQDHQVNYSYDDDHLETGAASPVEDLLFLWDSFGVGGTDSHGATTANTGEVIPADSTAGTSGLPSNRSQQQQHHQDSYFSDQELIDAIQDALGQSIGGGGGSLDSSQEQQQHQQYLSYSDPLTAYNSNNNLTEGAAPSEYESLPEIDLDFPDSSGSPNGTEDDDDLQLLLAVPPEEFDHIFDDDNVHEGGDGDDDDEVLPDSQTEEHQPIEIEPEPVVYDSHQPPPQQSASVLDILDQLEGLQIGSRNSPSLESLRQGPFSLADYEDDYEDYNQHPYPEPLPPYLYCQPCSPAPDTTAHTDLVTSATSSGATPSFWQQASSQDYQPIRLPSGAVWDPRTLPTTNDEWDTHDIDNLEWNDQDLDVLLQLSALTLNPNNTFSACETTLAAAANNHLDKSAITMAPERQTQPTSSLPQAGEESTTLDHATPASEVEPRPRGKPDSFLERKEHHTASQESAQDRPQENNIQPPPPAEYAATTISPHVKEGAKIFAEAFGVDLFSADSANTLSSTTQVQQHDQSRLPPRRAKGKERTGFGHKERILGMDLTNDGKLLATASQDGTACIWNVFKNKKLATLRHDRAGKQECLRVAWASDQWGRDPEMPPLPKSDTEEDTKTGDNDDDKRGSQDRMRWFGHSHLLATGGAEGRVLLWGSADPFEPDSWTCLETLDHDTYSHSVKTKEEKKKMNDGDRAREAEDDDDDKEEDEDENDGDGDKPQIYSLQFIDHWKALPNNDDDVSNNFLMTSSDDHIHLWEMVRNGAKKSRTDDSGSGSIPERLQFKEVISLRFGHFHETGYGVYLTHVTSSGMMTVDESAQSCQDSHSATRNDTSYRFGGDRNPHNLVYVFDAVYSSANGLLGVALSDGTLRLMNGRGVCLAILQLPGDAIQAHLTSLAWDSTGQRLATCVGTGHVVTWNINWDAWDFRQHSHEISLRASCCAILQGGHVLGRPLFGTRYCSLPQPCPSDTTATEKRPNQPDYEHFLISWGVDGRLCLWNADAQGDIASPLAILWDKPEYPLYAVEFGAQGDGQQQSGNGAKAGLVVTLGGGASDDNSFLGTPVYFCDVPLPYESNPSAASTTTITHAKA